MIPSYIIDQIRNEANANIVDIISEHVELKPSGSSMKAKCPFHEENTPSFSVSEAKGIYKCFGGCGASGDAVNFLIEYTGQSFIEVIKDLANRFHIDIPKDENYIPPPDRPTIHSVLDRYQKVDIRKAGFAFLVFSEKEKELLNAEDGQPVILVSNPVKELEAKALIKCTSNLILKADSGRLTTDQFWESMRMILKQETNKLESATVYIQPANAIPEVQKAKLYGSLSFDPLTDWLSHSINHTQPNEWLRRQIVKTLAVIPDRLTRNIFKNHFFDQWDKRLTV